MRRRKEGGRTSQLYEISSEACHSIVSSLGFSCASRVNTLVHRALWSFMSVHARESRIESSIFGQLGLIAGFSRGRAR